MKKRAVLRNTHVILANFLIMKIAAAVKAGMVALEEIEWNPDFPVPDDFSGEDNGITINGIDTNEKYRACLKNEYVFFSKFAIIKIDSLLQRGLIKLRNIEWNDDFPIPDGYQAMLDKVKENRANSDTYFSMASANL